MAKDVKFNIKLQIDGKEHLVTATTNAKALGDSLGIATTKSSALRRSLSTFGNVSMSLQGAMAGIQQLTGLIDDWTAANATQIEAETKLATVMRQRMDATEEQIASIKRLATEQQALGIIGDEVQLAGAQQIATFLQEKESLETLIPAMNNLLAQQKGINATQTDAVSIGNMIGKVMQGQTSALKRVGITFTEAQEQALKYGTELERAAALAEVITDNVGEMNAELAKTDAGKAKQLSNTIGDIKEKIGGLFSSIQPAIVAAGQLGLAISSIGTVSGGIRTVAASITLLTRQLKAAILASRTLKIALIGALSATGIGIAIAAISALLEHFAQKAEEAKQAAEELRKATQAYEDTAARAKGEITLYISKLQALKDSHQEDIDLVKELNGKYGEAMGTYQSVAAWYDTLTAKSAAYVKQKGYEAQAIQIATDMAEKELRLETLRAQQASTQKTTTQLSAGGRGYTTVTTNEWSDLQKEIELTEAQITSMSKELDSVTGKMNSASEQLKSASDNTAATAETSKKTTKEAKTGYDAVCETLKKYEAALNAADLTDKEKVDTLATLINQYRLLKTEMESTMKLSISGNDLNKRLSDLGGNLTKQQGVEITANAETLEIPNAVVEVDIKTNDDQLEEEAERISDKMRRAMQPFQQGWSGISGIQGGIESITSAIEEDASEWEVLSSVISGVFQVFQGITSVIEMIESLSAATKTEAAVETMAAMAKTQKATASAESATASGVEAGASGIAATASGIEAAADTQAAVAKTMKAHSAIPFVGIAIGAAMAATMLALIASSSSKTKKFAEGGIVSGATLGLIGEYPGASNNPEVVAPLDKLRSMIEPSGISGNVSFRIDGSQLVGVLANETRVRSKSGKSTKIQI